MAALLSPSQLLSAGPEAIIHPTLHPLTAPPGYDGVQALPLILAEAITIAQQHRTRIKPNGRSWGRRRGSGDTNPSSTPPHTPSLRGTKLNSLGSYQSSPRQSFDGSCETGRPGSSVEYTSDMEMRHSTSGLSLSGMVNISRPSSKTRLSSFSRDSIFGGLTKVNDTDSKTSLSGLNTFDAVINFIPRAAEFAPERALQEMLHQAVVLTTGVMPIITRRTDNTSGQHIGLPISLLHVLPAQVPGPLPSVIESFLLSLVPLLTQRGDREAWASVITTPSWLADRVQQNLSQPDDFDPPSGAEVLLFGGVRCFLNVQGDHLGEGIAKSRAFLATWASCRQIPGLFEGTRKRSLSAPPKLQRLRTDPAFLAYRDLNARLSPLSTDGYTTPPTAPLSSVSEPAEAQRSRLVALTSPPTPELDPSTASLSSSSGSGDSTGPEQVEIKPTQVRVSETGKKGFTGWLRSKQKAMTVGAE